MKKFALALACLFFAGVAGAADLSTLERQVYGSAQSGDQATRLANLERDLFGRPLPGDTSSREKALVQFFSRSEGTAPSLEFKLDMLAWALGDADNFVHPMAKRLDQLESLAGVASQSGKPLTMRVESLVGHLYGDHLVAADAVAGAGTVVRLVILTSLSAQSAPGTPFWAQTTADVFSADRQLLAPRGALVSGRVVSVAPAKGASSFTLALDGLWGLGENPLPLAQNGGAAGTLVIKGNTQGLPAGTTLLAQVPTDTNTKAYRPDATAKTLRAAHPERPQTLAYVAQAPQVSPADSLSQQEVTDQALPAQSTKVIKVDSGDSVLDRLANEGVISRREATGRPSSGFDTIPEGVKPLTDLDFNLSKLWPFGKKKAPAAPAPATVPSNGTAAPGMPAPLPGLTEEQQKEVNQL